MTTEAQIEANRANAQKSTGPRTPAGKAKVAQNAVTHGLLARQVVVVGEEEDEFDLYRDQFRADLAPVGMVESVLVERIAELAWRLRRAERFHTEAFDVMYAQNRVDPQIKRKWPPQAPEAADPLIGVTVVKDFSETKVLERLLVYERRIENSLYRTMAELRKVQGLRQAGGLPGPNRGGAVRDTHPTAMTLDNLPAALAASEGTPDGVTTNVSQAESQSCETKPICGSQCGTGIPSASLSGQALPVAVDQGQICETKPICASGNKGQFGYTPVFRRRR